ncbi:MAG: glycosyltransferase [Rhodospirillaceae bacterium]|nr:glycosyltransferase [Rhodospirillaceae bacterium]
MTEAAPSPREAPQAEGLSERKRAIRDLFDRLAPERPRWRARNAFFYEEDEAYLRFLVPGGLRVLDLGCGIGDTLAALNPSVGIGVDLSERMVALARERHPSLEFHTGDIEDPALLDGLKGPFDVILLSDTIGFLEDVEEAFRRLHGLCDRDTRIVVAYHSRLWEPLLNLVAAVGLKSPAPAENYLRLDDISCLLQLADFEIIKREWRQLLPKRLAGLGVVVNRFIATLPLFRGLCLRNYVVARSDRLAGYEAPLSATVVVPARNEKGNIEPLVQRLPAFCPDIELVFVEGHSQDGTLEEMERVAAAYPDRDIKVLVQDGRGKGDAVRKAFDAARGDVLMILDADMTVPPEQMAKFYQALQTGKGEFVNGTRLVYPMEDQAMRFLNLLANHIFSVLFSFLLNQRFTDTLCGTKVLTRAHYRRIADNRDYFGEFDPFGDFDLIFGAAKLNLKVVEVPIRYASRRYGETQISRFRHGWLLLQMVVFAFRKLKAF